VQAVAEFVEQRDHFVVGEGGGLASARRRVSMRSPRRSRSPSWSTSGQPPSTSSGSTICSCRPAAAPCPTRSAGSRRAC
jgi:hypothetical protein